VGAGHHLVGITASKQMGSLAQRAVVVPQPSVGEVAVAAPR
jgi:hypothetical protein